MTVEGWIEEERFGRYVEVFRYRDPSAQETGIVFDRIDSPSVVFLPEPVQFKDGDVIRYTAKSQAGVNGVRVRVGTNSWRSPEGFTAKDAYVREALRKGEAVRLVPEANGG